ncbi:hypothetical protein FRC11_014608 [Ceratobasidium sp. 423]|nr:hypothetical protein FRC11_014608 [Ceratobasidium sp. 423]
MAQVPVYPSRAQKEPTTAQAELPASHNNYQDCKKYIKKALQAHTENTNFGQQVERRALIIAPQYKDYEEGMHLPATALDIHLVHKMLVEFGYEPENIRILCDVCPGSGNSYPTKTNIINGLKWLVKESDLTPNAFRFLHFSGHGVRISSSDQTGPGKRIKDSDWKPEMTPVTQDSERSSSQMFAGRITTQKVLLDAELKYYNEDLDKKVAGSGWRAAWRGRPIAPVAAGPIISTSISSPQDTSALPFKEGASESDQPLSMGISKLSMKDLPKIQTEHEDLPHAEKAMNNVVAKIVCSTPHFTDDQTN